MDVLVVMVVWLIIGGRRSGRGGCGGRAGRACLGPRSHRGRCSALYHSLGIHSCAIYW